MAADNLPLPRDAAGGKSDVLSVAQWPLVLFAWCVSAQMSLFFFFCKCMYVCDTKT